jgi:hypothetical protein
MIRIFGAPRPRARLDWDIKTHFKKLLVNF